MIYCYTGTPGSGKSLHVARLLREHCYRSDALIITNYPVNLPRAKATVVCLDTVTFGLIDVIEVYRDWRISHPEFREGQCLLVIDECQLIFSNRDWNKPGRKAWISFFTQHRKLGFDCILVVQSMDMVDKQIRAIVEYEVSHFKASNYGWFGRLINVFTLGRPMIIANMRIPSYGRTKAGIVSKRSFIGTKKDFEIYDTRAMFGADLHALAEMAADAERPR